MGAHSLMGLNRRLAGAYSWRRANLPGALASVRAKASQCAGPPSGSARGPNSHTACTLRVTVE
jgi:hypothetical protein